MTAGGSSPSASLKSQQLRLGPRLLPGGRPSISPELPSLARLVGLMVSGASTTFFYLFRRPDRRLLMAEAVGKFGLRNCLYWPSCFALFPRRRGRDRPRRTPWQYYAANALPALRFRAGTNLALITGNTLEPLVRVEARGMAISLALNSATSAALPACRCSSSRSTRFGFPGAMTAAAAIAIVLLVVPIVVLIFVGQPPHHLIAAVQRRPRAAPSPAWKSRRGVYFAISASCRCRSHCSPRWCCSRKSASSRAPRLVPGSRDPGAGTPRSRWRSLTAMAMAGRVLFSTVIDRLNQRLASGALYRF